MSQGDTSEQRHSEHCPCAHVLMEEFGTEDIVDAVVGLREQLEAAEAVFENAGEGAKDLLARAKAAEKERARAQDGWDACAELLEASGSDYQRESEIARAHEHELGVLRGRLEKAQALLHEVLQDTDSDMLPISLLERIDTEVNS